MCRGAARANHTHKAQAILFHHFRLTVRLSLSHCTVEPAYAIDPSRAYTQGPFPSWKPTVLRRPWVDGTTWTNSPLVNMQRQASQKRRLPSYHKIQKTRVNGRLGHSEHPRIEIITSAHWSTYTHSCRYFLVFPKTSVVSRRSRYNILCSMDPFAAF